MYIDEIIEAIGYAPPNDTLVASRGFTKVKNGGIEVIAVFNSKNVYDAFFVDTAGISYIGRFRYDSGVLESVR